MSDIEKLLIQFENASHASEHAAYQGHIRTADIKAKRAADKRDEIIALFAAKDAEIAKLKGEVEKARRLVENYISGPFESMPLSKPIIIMTKENHEELKRILCS